MSLTLSDLQRQLAAKIDLEATPPTVGSDDWNLRGALINETQRDWAERFDWSVLRVTDTTSTISGNASYGLPSTFKRMERYVTIAGNKYQEVKPIEASYMSSSNDRYYYITGNSEDGYALNINPAPTSGPTVMTYTYYEYPSELSTASSTSPCQNPYYLVQSAYARTLELDEDKRFPPAKAEAEAILQQMLENEYMSLSPSLKERRRIKTRYKYASMMSKGTPSADVVKDTE